MAYKLSKQCFWAWWENTTLLRANRRQKAIKLCACHKINCIELINGQNDYSTTCSGIASAGYFSMMSFVPIPEYTRALLSAYVFSMRLATITRSGSRLFICIRSIAECANKLCSSSVFTDSTNCQQQTHVNTSICLSLEMHAAAGGTVAVPPTSQVSRMFPAPWNLC